MNLSKLFLTTLISTILSSYVLADTVTSKLDTSAKINATCQLTVNNLTFGQYVPSQGDGFASGDVSVKCTKGTSATVGINHTGTNPFHLSNLKYSYSEGGLSYSRYMNNANNKLYYNLFQDSSYTKIFGGANWFTTTPGSRPIVVGDGTVKKVPIYAAMAANQYVRPGSYLDSLVVEVVF